MSVGIFSMILRYCSVRLSSKVVLACFLTCMSCSQVRTKASLPPSTCRARMGRGMRCATCKPYPRPVKPARQDRNPKVTSRTHTSTRFSPSTNQPPCSFSTVGSGFFTASVFETWALVTAAAQSDFLFQRARIAACQPFCASGVTSRTLIGSKSSLRTAPTPELRFSFCVGTEASTPDNPAQR
jgi:putative component of membrane protein insertase Oxa1/YidC/SpoIIIJ protein YidD